MAWLLFSGILLLAIAGTYFAFRRNKKAEPLNVQEENRLPQKTIGTEEEHYHALVFLASWAIEKNAKGRTVKLDFSVQWLKQKFDHEPSIILSDIALALTHSTNIRSVSNWIRAYLKSVAQREEILEFVLNVAFADGDIIDREYVAIARFCELIGIRLDRLAKEIHDRRDVIYVDGEIPAFNDGSFFRRKALHTLGLTTDASSEEIRKIYRKLVVEFHPDKQAGKSEEEQEANAARFLAIRDAYEFLVKR